MGAARRRRLSTGGRPYAQRLPSLPLQGFTAHARVQLTRGKRSLIATLYQVTGDLLAHALPPCSAAGRLGAWREVGLNRDAGAEFPLFTGYSAPRPSDAASGA